MPVLRRRDQDGLDRFVLQQLPVIPICFWCAPLAFAAVESPRSRFGSYTSQMAETRKPEFF